ncbi:MAG: hypothetical protein LKM43_02350 [Wolbachia endosymbiont of Penenirmus auritus]|nr:hypothetical protein [Wolbachia endosymbiont of Penenirmus auritus]
MPIFTNHRGQRHVMNTALVALTSLYVIGAAVALSSPYWASSYPVLAPLVAFASTPLGIGVLIAVSAALIGLAVYAISKNNEISELRAPKIVIDDKGQLLLMLTRDVLKEVKENNQHKDEKGKEIQDQYCIYFTNSEGKGCRVIISNKMNPLSMGNALCLPIHSLELKNKEGKYEDMQQQVATLGLNQNGAKEFNTYLGSVVVEQAASQGQKK